MVMTLNPELFGVEGVQGAEHLVRYLESSDWVLWRNDVHCS